MSNPVMDSCDLLLAIDQIRQLKSRYFRFLDTQDFEGMATVFAADALFDLRTGGSVEPLGGEEGEGAILRGRDAILAFFRSSMPGIVSVHHGHCHEVWVDSQDSARGVIAMEDINTRADTGELMLHGYGHYHEHYVLEDGQWRIARSRLSRLKVELGPGLAAVGPSGTSNPS